MLGRLLPLLFVNRQDHQPLKTCRTILGKKDQSPPISRFDMSQPIKPISVIVYLSRRWIFPSAMLIMLHERCEFCRILRRQLVQFFSDGVLMERDKFAHHRTKYKLSVIIMSSMTVNFLAGSRQPLAFVDRGIEAQSTSLAISSRSMSAKLPSRVNALSASVSSLPSRYLKAGPSGSTMRIVRMPIFS